MSFSELFAEYANKNAELRSVAKTCYEFGKTISQEPSAGLSLGLDEHAIKRQRNYVQIVTGQVKALHERPIPDLPAIHPTQFPINLSEEYGQFTQDDIPLNEDTELLAEYWMFLAVGLAKSQSASLAGSLIDADNERANNQLSVITQLLDEIEARPTIDVPETAFPGATLTKSSAKK